MARRRRSEYPAILVAVPAYPAGQRIHPQTLAAVEALEWPGRVDVMQMRHDGALGDPYADLAAKLEQARRLATAGDYAGLLIVEADMLPPSDALRRLMDVDADIAYGLYCSRRDGHVWLLAKTLNEEQAEWLDEAGMAEAWANVVPSAGVGTGCTLLKRPALERVQFRTVEGSYAPDWWLALDAQAAGLRQMHDCGCICGHIVQASPFTVVFPAQWGFHVTEESPAQWELSAAGLYEVVSRLTFMRDGEEPAYHGPGDVVALADNTARVLLAAHKIRGIEG